MSTRFTTLNRLLTLHLPNPNRTRYMGSFSDSNSRRAHRAVHCCLRSKFCRVIALPICSTVWWDRTFLRLSLHRRILSETMGCRGPHRLCHPNRPVDRPHLNTTNMGKLGHTKELRSPIPPISANASTVQFSNTDNERKKCNKSFHPVLGR